MRRLPGFNGEVTERPTRYGEPAATPPARRRIPLRVWFLGLLVAAIVLISALGGIRSWWAHRLHDMTGGNKGADFGIGFVVGMLPLFAVALGAARSRGRSRIRRLWRMFWFGAVGFVVTYLLSPSLTRLVTDSGARRVFNDQAPGYLAGILTGTGLWVLVLVVAVARVRARRRSMPPGRRPPPGLDDDGRSHRIVDI